MDWLKPKKNSLFRFIVTFVFIVTFWLLVGSWMMTHDSRSLTTIQIIYFCVLFLNGVFWGMLFFVWWNAIPLLKQTKGSHGPKKYR